jgi:hypothetical protein
VTNLSILLVCPVAIKLAYTQIAGLFDYFIKLLNGWHDEFGAPHLFA